MRGVADEQADLGGGVGVGHQGVSVASRMTKLNYATRLCE
jgi:hypothetical protein